jgi:hypothetical protein
MASSAWKRRRQAWWRAQVEVNNGEPVCAVCSRTWSVRDGDLHHRTYRRLGREADADLIPLCRTPCHQRVHQILESNPAWLRAGRADATDVIVARMRAAIRQGEDHA